ncbi:DUF4251 domain-containing protein [Chitinophaga sancti]|uniref:DUF4251 domain-containing protein n=1 Tax=Chitinophaga sancti TaxID=1004 RepID=A0A1K1NH45_9BACT|nr:DUF4251 domain-containing protein [Chitinophaga sancti]WQD63283.1 DUF4251 domain-containing protein [Chitinophaga sancti]WQG91091.1 DUF4251 domain-containing protein [Chitinophaga sancti]SFW33726.1 protein of unknown function [Chitinophaga sancti]
MKNMLIAGVMALAISLPGFTSAQSKSDEKKTAITNLINNQTYVFTAQSSIPAGPSPDRQLNGNYDLTVTKDSVISYLPYFGRVYTAPMDPTKGGIQFTSTKFDYKVTEKKKGGWTIVIKPRDTDQASQLILNVSTAGYSSLQVIGNNRQPILFNGTVDARKLKK